MNPALAQSAQDRLAALELRVAQLAQAIVAQRTQQSDGDDVPQVNALSERLAALEQQLAALSRAAPREAENAATQSEESRVNTSDFTQMQEILRQINGRTDQLTIGHNALIANLERMQKDNEFRFQQLEKHMRRTATGQSSTSVEPEIIGRVRRSAPVEALGASGGNNVNADVKLVGEGDMPYDSVLGDIPARALLADPKALYERALRDLRNGAYHLAEADFIGFLANHPKHKLAGNAQYWLGESYYVRKQYKRAAKAFLAGYSNYAKGNKAPDTLLKLGMTLSAMGEKKQGCDAFADLAGRFPNASTTVLRRAKIEQDRAGCDS